MDGQKETTLQISGMTCAACAARIEKGLKRLDGVEAANVNLALEKSKVVYDPAKIEVGQLAEKVESLGYQVAAEKAEFAISGMTCAACANRIEKRLNKLPGVKSAAVNFALETAAVEYHPGAVSLEDMREAADRLGYKMVLKTDRGRDSAAEQREKDIQNQPANLFFPPFYPFLCFGRWSAISSSRHLYGCRRCLWTHGCNSPWLRRLVYRRQTILRRRL